MQDGDALPMGWQARIILQAFVMACAQCNAGTDDFAQTSALLLLKATLDPSGTSLESWNPSTDPCTWGGLSCNSQGQVTSM